MKLTNIRSISTEDSTLGVLLKDNKPFGFVIEDEYRKKKVKSETRIPCGEYVLKLRKSLTPLTLRYRRKYPWFSWHIELQDVKNFTGVYIHIGNFEQDTAGCQCIGELAGIVKNIDFMVLNSTPLFKKLYLELVEKLENGEKCTYSIINNDLNYVIQ